MSWLANLSEWTFRNSVDGAILFLLVGTILLIFRSRLAPQVKIAMLVLVGFRFFLPVAPESSWSFRAMIPEVPLIESRRAEKESPAIETSNAERGDRLRKGSETANGPTGNPVESNEPGQSRIPMIVMLIWVTGAVSVLFFAMIQWAMASRRIRSLRDYTDEEGLLLLRQVGIPEKIRIVEGASGEGVAVFGLFQVTSLVLPSNFLQQYGREGATGILRHEMEHIRGKDLLQNWLILLMQSWHWFNPAVWIAGRLYQNEREILCDHFALKNQGDQVRRTYGSTLIKALEAGRFHDATPSMISFVSRKNELKQRLELIMKNKPYQIFIQLSTIAVIVAFSLASFTSPPSFAAEDGQRAPEALRDGDKKRADGGKVKDGPKDGEAKKAGPRDGDRKKDGPRDGDKPKAEGDGKAKPDAQKAAMNTKAGKVFTTYDKDRDGFVSAEEIAGMKEGKQNSRAKREIRKAVKRADKDDDDTLNLKEFTFWYDVGRRDEKAEFR